MRVTLDLETSGRKQGFGFFPTLEPQSQCLISTPVSGSPAGTNKITNARGPGIVWGTLSCRNWLRGRASKPQRTGLFLRFLVLLFRALALLLVLFVALVYRALKDFHRTLKACDLTKGALVHLQGFRSCETHGHWKVARLMGLEVQKDRHIEARAYIESILLQALTAHDRHKLVAAIIQQTNETLESPSEAAPDTRQSCSCLNLSRFFCSSPSPGSFERCGSGLEFHARGDKLASVVSASWGASS